MSTLTESIKPHKSHKRGPNFISNGQKKFVKSRKRSKSFTGGGLGKIKTFKSVLPSKFLLGGNINDPLNLNSLQDEEINRAMNAVTPKSSPIPTPPRRRGQVEVIIPPNINDPLNLIDCADDAEYEQQLCSPIKKGRKKKARKRRTTSGTLYSDSDMNVSEAQTPEASKDSAKVPEATCSATVVKESTSTNKEGRDLQLDFTISPKKDKPKRKSEDHKDNVKKLKYAMDKIVSPVVPQPGAWLKRNTNRNQWQHKHRNQNKGAVLVMPKFKEKDKQYQYGNYNRYYGYRNAQHDVDARLKCFVSNRDLFERKDILDIGCNIGHITLTVARDFGARSVVGIDIDKNLIGIARKNIKHYVSSANIGGDATSPLYVDYGHDEGATSTDPSNSCPRSKVVASCNSRAVRELKQKSSFSDKRKGKGFPHNVTFVQGNYVLEDDALINTEQPQFDVILCLSITKWIHLNWGDKGIKQAFRRMYAQLRPGGKLVLEPQSWTSYKTKKKLTETIYKNYNTIQFFPENFTQYLLSPEVGFAKSEILAFPQHHSKGFQRPVQVYTKSTMFPSERVECTPSTRDVERPETSTRRVYAPLPTPEDNEPEYTCNNESRSPLRNNTDSNMSSSAGEQDHRPVSVQEQENVSCDGCADNMQTTTPSSATNGIADEASRDDIALISPDLSSDKT
ncbi:7SK snRNA methylphosphate capping enzyme bin3-like isoform X2 [Atheta coriaria]|uniref:7SK snRNA methylphosphate capping enzyme bin3-like isoform X2 n=1 Tax=Dalotia coriaria TaxID=877792 RepID=UPI0031F3805B